MRLKYVDVLKALAIIAVVLYHSGFMPYGYLGVDLFLVINGYLVTKGLKHKLLNNSEYSGCRGYFQFEVSRIERLLPPLIIAGIVCMLVGFFVMTDDTYESLSQSVIATNFFGNNIVELIAAGNYWAANKVFSPLMHTWYVGVIMQFYLFYPLLFYIAKIDKNNPLKNLLTLITVFGLISLFVFIGEQSISRKFYLLPARFFEFTAGGIVALLYNPENKSFKPLFVYFCFALVLSIFTFKTNLIPANIKLLIVVSAACVLLSSQKVLENKVSGNVILARIGAASYSIFIWHQILLAFYRSIWGSQLEICPYIMILLTTGLLSWLSYQFIEQYNTKKLKEIRGKRFIYSLWGILFVVLNGFALYIYKNAGVVRDIPELEVKLDSPKRGQWSDYNERIRKETYPFETRKLHWFVIGNSYGRDFVNIINESNISTDVEVRYCEVNDFEERKYEDLFMNCDKIFIASKGLTDDLVHRVELLARAFGHANNDVIVVGEKYFGETMTYIYVRRFNKDYYQTSIKLDDELIQRNNYFSATYSDRFIDLINIVVNSAGETRLFTDDKKLISSDCTHLTKAGCKYFAQRIEWDKYK